MIESCQVLLSLIAASVGVVSGLWLCSGAALIKAKHIVNLADQSWKADPDISGALASQSGEYLAGGLLLLLAFALQIAAALAPSTSPPELHPVFLTEWGAPLVVVLSAAVSVLIAYPIYRSRRAFLLEQVAQLQSLKKTT